MSSDPAPNPQDKYRLPTNVKPSHYNLVFWTDLESLEFGGVATVDLDILQETTSIILNCSADLKLREASIHCTDLGANEVQSAVTITADEELCRATLNFANALPSGSKAQAKISYTAPLRATMNGYYKSAWQREGKTEYYALTHFQPTDARAAFPCWDEPQLKATWTITMISRADTVNISNMPVESEAAYDYPTSSSSEASLVTPPRKEDVKWKVTKFQKSPPMSSYLVAFANGPFEYLHTSVTMPLSGKNIPLRLYATPDIVHQGEFCLEVAKKVLPLYEEIFDIEYPLPKLDFLPASDFDIGAMENWGLITGRTVAFMMDPKKADIASKKWIAEPQVMMWLICGLETLRPCGFATLVRLLNSVLTTLPDKLCYADGRIIILRSSLEWEVDATFIANHVQRALTLDAKRSSHPIEVECPDANFLTPDIRTRSLIRKLPQYIGEEKFMKGVSLYLKAHLYGNSVTRDLWEGISTASGLFLFKIQFFPDSEITGQDIIGFPLITVTETPNGIHVRQDRFLNSGAPNADENETIWFGGAGFTFCYKLIPEQLIRTVPVSILTVNEADGQVNIDKTAVLDEREKDIALDTGKTFKLNSGTIGLYRVSYTPDRLKKIAIEAAKENSVFSLSDRIGLLFDVSELANAGLTQVSTLLTLIDIWKNETHRKWQSNSILRPFEDHPQISASLRAFIRTLFIPLVQRLGYEFREGESVDIVQLRKNAITGAVAGRDESTCRRGDQTNIPSDIKRPIFSTAARAGGREEFDALLNIIEHPANQSDRSAAIFAIGHVQEESVLNELFSYMLTKARDQDVVHFCIGMEANPIARPMLVPFFKENYDTFSKRFATNSMLKYMVTSCFRGLSTQAAHDDAEEYFKDKDTTRYSMALAQALETIRVRIAYIKRSGDDLEKWLMNWEQQSQI
ncbi:aminopeptidase 1 [Favolaschia claudopus]|uniref:Aminopeptidase n=1 Tax=Favolaschia claudopus TaxID=2862362 RepID=A0AAW0CHT1_9AGAR